MLAQVQVPVPVERGGGYSMDDRVDAGVGCERYKKAEFVKGLG